jgi:hypothetical protein
MREYFKSFGLIFFLFLPNIAAALPIPNAGQIIISLPICSLNSSLGQRCKSLSKGEKNTYRLYTNQNIKNINLKPITANIETDDWYYSIDNVNQSIAGFTFKFTDDAKFATYLTVIKFSVKLNEISKTWMIVGEELLYISGNDQETIGQYIEYDNPIKILLD